MNISIRNNSSSLKVKDEIRKTVQGFKLVKPKLNQAEVSRISGVSESNLAHDKNKMLRDFWSEDSPPAKQVAR